MLRNRHFSRADLVFFTLHCQKRWKRSIPTNSSQAKPVKRAPAAFTHEQPFFAPYFTLDGVPKHTENTALSAQIARTCHCAETHTDNHVVGFRQTRSGEGLILYGQCCIGKTRGIHIFRPISSLKWCYFTARRNPRRVFLQILFFCVRTSALLLFFSFVYNRYFGTEMVELVSETQGMRFLHNTQNEVDGIYVRTTENEALVVLPNDVTHQEGTSSHHFRFHISNLLNFEKSLLHVMDHEEAVVRSLWDKESTVQDSEGVEGSEEVETSMPTPPPPPPAVTDGAQPLPSPRPIYYSYYVTFPWVPILLLGLLPIFGVIQSKFRFLRFNLLQKGFPFNKEANEIHFSILSERSKTKFKDIAGMAEPKQEVMEVVDFLLHPTKYHRMGASVPKGIMLSGPPGVGKTLLAKAVAGEADVNFIACTGSEFVEIFVGVGASRVRELFTTARKSAPCVVFIDEIDAFAKSRKMGEKSPGGGGQGEGDNTVNALLSELDGFHPTSGVVVIAGTNRVDVIDEALLRPGRFDRKIHVDPPTYLDRIQIFKLHLAPLKLLRAPGEGVQELASQLAARTPGNSGADIKNICNESAIIAARDGKKVVDMESITKGLERVQIGLKRESKVLTPDERDRAAYHEAGHAVVNWHLAHADPICQVSIVQYTGKPMSHNQKLPSDKFIYLQAELDDRLCDMLGGAIAEDLFLKEFTSSAAEDSHRATSFAYDYVTRYGMCPETIGHFSFPSSEAGVTIQKPYSSMVEKKIDEAVKEIVKRCKERARTILVENEHAVRAVYGSLKKQERLSAVDLTNLLGPRKVMSKEFSEYLAAK